MSNPAYKGTGIPGLDPDLDQDAVAPRSDMSAEQASMLNQMAATPRQESPPPMLGDDSMPMQPPPQQFASAPVAVMNPALLKGFSDQFKKYSAQHDASLAQLQQYMKDYRDMPQRNDYQALAAFVDSLPQNKGSNLSQAAAALAPESPQKRAQNLIANQENVTKQLGESANMANMARILQAQQRNEMMAQRNDLGQARLENQKMKEARSTVNNDPMLKQFAPRLEGAAKIGELITAANEGKVVSNQALLGQLNAEIARLETGAQAPGLHAAEKTELLDAKAQLSAFKDQITGKPSDAVRPEVLGAASKMVDELSGSYMKGIDSRMQLLKGGMEPQMRGVVDEKHNSMLETYAPRFGGWNGLNQIKIYQGKKYQMQGDHWVQVP